MGGRGYREDTASSSPASMDSAIAQVRPSKGQMTCNQPSSMCNSKTKSMQLLTTVVLAWVVGTRLGDSNNADGSLHNKAAHVHGWMGGEGLAALM